jgi:hypothetical protein
MPVFAKCPECQRHVTLDEDGAFKKHPKNADMGAGSRKCKGSGKASTRR